MVPRTLQLVESRSGNTAVWACCGLRLPPLPPTSPRCPLPADGATAIALLIYALPLYWRSSSSGVLTEGSQGEITADYISSMRLLNNTSK